MGMRAVAKSCPTLGDLMGCSLPGSSVHGFPREAYWSGLSFPPPGDLPDPGIEPPCLAQLEHWEVASLPRSHMGSPTLSQTTAQNPSDFVPFLTASNSLEDAFGDRVYWDT